MRMHMREGEIKRSELRNLAKNLWVRFGLRMQASDKNNKSHGRGQSAGLLSRPGPRMPPEQRRGEGSPAASSSRRLE